VIAIESKAKEVGETLAVSNGLRDVCIVMPTYNEADNILKVLDRIFENARIYSASRRFVNLMVLVVDDSSPDGTASLVSGYMRENPKVHLLLRTEKQGLGAAYIAGMKYALANLDPDVIFEMDADMSHNPDDIFRMLEAMEDGADMVIGSRYIRGGEVASDWGIHRRFISGFANLLTKVSLRIPKIKDCTGGFRAIRASALRKIDLDALQVKGYAFQVSLLVSLLDKGSKVVEIPIMFSERESGQSKMRLKDITEMGMLMVRMGTKRMFSNPFG
jgi:dolichol-phosphate mannosyltransferase